MNMLHAFAILFALTLAACDFKAEVHTGQSAPEVPFTWEAMKPQFRVRTNSPTEYQVEFKAYNSPNWVTVTNLFKSSLDADLAIADSILDLRIKWEVGQAILEAIGKSRTK